MQQLLNESLWKQFGASIKTLENAILLCPENLWDTEQRFWYNAYHTLFFLDYYLTPDAKTFLPPTPFTLSEFEDTMPERVYSKDEILAYLQYCRRKCHDFINSITADNIETHWVNASKTMDYPIVEILLYNMRHVQHHAAQLNLILRQEINDAPDWVSRVELKL